MKIGLTLGKFAPFHKGHEFLIKSALYEVDKLIVVIYNASLTTNIPTHVRAQWIRNIFPEVEVIEANDGPQEIGYTHEIILKQNKYLRKILGGAEIHYFFSSEHYGDPVSKYFNCTNRVIDLTRRSFKISGTAIRNNPYKYKDYLSEIVWNSIKPKIIFLGGPSTGKSTIARICSSLYDGIYCEEYGRSYWFKNHVNHRLSIEDLVQIGHGQNQLISDSENKDKNIIFIDTTPLTTLAYSKYYFGNYSKKVQSIFKDYKHIYDDVFLCDQDFPFEDTWDRSGPSSRTELQLINEEILSHEKIKYQILSGSIEERTKIISNYLKEKYGLGNTKY